MKGSISPEERARLEAEDSGARKQAEHYFTKKPTAASRPRLLTLFANGRELLFKTDSSVFSPKKIDNATVLLIEYMRPKGDVLDMGCGYGPIGIVAAAINPKCEVTMAEFNERAAGLARENLRLNKITNALVIDSDFFEAVPGKFDTIAMNPPMAIGAGRLSRLIEECAEHLKKGGALWIVARHNKGGSRLEERMQEVFGNVKTVEREGGFRVYMSIRSK